MRREGLGLVLVWLASATPLFLELQSSWDRELSLGALALLPWLVWATLPRTRERAGFDLALAPWLALPLAVLALALDRAREQAWAGALGAVLGSALLAGAFALAAARSARSARGRAAYATAWFALVLGAPALANVLESVGAPLYGRANGVLALVARLSPLEWWRTQIRAPGPAAGLAVPWLPLALAALLFVIAASARAPSEERT